VSDKFIGFFRLVDACERAGCPVCTCLGEDSRRAVGTLLYEGVTDAETRHRLRAAWGVCNWHAAGLLAGAGAATGVAILFEDLVRVCEERVDRLRGRTGRPLPWPLAWIRRAVPPLVAEYRSRARCPLCGALDAGEASYLDAIVDFAEDPQLARAYERSAGLCVPHLVRMVERCSTATGVQTITRATVRKWQRLRGELAGFVSKHEYRNAEPITEAEAESRRLASEILAGHSGVFGNDMRADVEGLRHRGACEQEPREQAVPDDFERRKLELRVQELTRALGEESARAAALHDRLARTAEERNALELNLAGERGTNELMTRALADLRAENERLRIELAAARSERSSQARAG
jgi:uncharacterized protein DUF6062